MANCVTCGDELHPERAEKYRYCTKPDCRARNARPRTIATVGVNKAADQFVVVDDRTAEEMESGRYRDAGRTSAGRLGHRRSKPASQRSKPSPRHSVSLTEPADRETWTKDEQNLALAYEITGRLPLEEIARRLGRDQTTVAKMLVAAKAGWGEAAAAEGASGVGTERLDRGRPD
jgi:hypothetical protein